MRAFISVELSEETKKEILRIQSQLPEFMGKKTELENLHLTLKFLGEISEQEVEQARERLREIKMKRFEAEIDETGVFTPSFIRIIWVSLTGCEKLQEEVDEKLEGLFGKEKRFMSHVTIARVKNVEDRRKFLEELRKIKFETSKSKDFDSDQKPQNSLNFDGYQSHKTLKSKISDKKKFLVDKFYLKESILHEKGPEYKIVEEFKLD